MLFRSAARACAVAMFLSALPQTAASRGLDEPAPRGSQERRSVQNESYFSVAQTKPSGHGTSQTFGTAQHRVAGIELGSRLGQSEALQRFPGSSCSSETQFAPSLWCSGKETRADSRGRYTVTTSLIITPDERVAYINQSLTPAFWNDGELDADIENYSKRLRLSPEIRSITVPTGGQSKIAIWGSIQLSPLNEQGRSLIRSNQSAQQGVIVDHISHFSQSEEQQLPLYRVASGRGFVWIGFSGKNRRGTLRFFAIDTDLIYPSPSTHVAIHPSPAPNQPSSSGHRGAGMPIAPTARSGVGIGPSPIITGSINRQPKTRSTERSKRKSALIIGNSKYQHVEQLTNPSNDAEDMASTLKFVGFDYVEVHKDLSG